MSFIGILGLLGAFSLIARGGKPTAIPIPLSSLAPECQLNVGYAQPTTVGSRALWLRCGSFAYVVVHPNNLYGHVRINTQADALEFVRLFTSIVGGQEMTSFTQLDGMMEVMPGPCSIEQPAWNCVKEVIFDRYLKRGEAKLMTDHASRGKEFLVNRAVIMPDQNIYLVKEVVNGNGWYEMYSRKKAAVTARELGIVYLLHD